MSEQPKLRQEPPTSDTEYQDSIVRKVRAYGDGGWDITLDSGWSCFVPASSPVEPKDGMQLRLYGRGIGYPFRGMTLDGCTVFYRTEREDRRHRDEETYGADAAGYLAKWDGDGHVWSLAAGGFGPGYEQALQIAMIEVLRHLVATKPDTAGWRDEARPSAWRAQVDAMHAPMMPILEPLGLSGAQWGAACGLAARIYLDGPIATLKDAPDDRRIQVSRHYPTLDPVILAAQRGEAA